MIGGILGKMAVSPLRIMALQCVNVINPMKGIILLHVLIDVILEI